MVPRSRLPHVGTTIFQLMSELARQHDAVNLGQGFPDYPIDPRLTELVAEAMRAGYNQYAPMIGVEALRAQIAARFARRYGLAVDPEREITVTIGATEAIFSAVQALIGPGDEAIVFDPAYDSYEPAVLLAGGRCVHLPLAPPQFAYDWQRVRAAVTARTRLIIINSPLNPACTCIGEQDLRELERLLEERDLALIADEVYEQVVFDGALHHSVLKFPALRARSVVVYSFGKTLHATGLRVGYAVAPPALSAELRKVHQFNTFTVPHALQVAVAGYLAERPDCGADLGAFFTARRDRLGALLAGGDFALLPSRGTYFQLIDYRALSSASDIEFADRLVREAGVAAIPLSVFYRQPPRMTLLRLCFAKREETLVEGAARLLAFARRASGAMA
jgi:methionine aminotransferase